MQRCTAAAARRRESGRGRGRAREVSRKNLRLVTGVGGLRPRQPAVASRFRRIQLLRRSAGHQQVALGFPCAPAAEALLRWYRYRASTTARFGWARRWAVCSCYWRIGDRDSLLMRRLSGSCGFKRNKGGGVGRQQGGCIARRCSRQVAVLCWQTCRTPRLFLRFHNRSMVVKL